MSVNRVVAITGCDSGLGWALAARSAREGLVTVAGMYQGADTKAAEALKKLQVHPYKLDVTDAESVAGFRNYVNGLLEDNPHYRLHAVVNNAGMMIVGNFEWQTPAMVQSMINVNLLGAMRVASAFLPDLRKSAAQATPSVATDGVVGNFEWQTPAMVQSMINVNLLGAMRVASAFLPDLRKSAAQRPVSKPRIINVASHCGLQPLPAFGAYCASKAGLLAWTRALRLEHYDHGVAALAFVPGGFVGSSNIIASQIAYGKAMIESLTEEQKALYEKQITTLTNYLGYAKAQDLTFDSMKDEDIIETFMVALTQNDPKVLYKVESWRYMIYYNLMRLPLPEIVYRWIIKMFLNFPEVK